MSSLIALMLSATPGPVTTSAPVVTTPPVDQTGVGLLGFLIVCALLVVCVGLFFAMRGSLRRLSGNENSGQFGVKPPATTDPHGS